ncbi:MAG TPA: chromosome segregation protein SMC [bacterium]|nr:chromosome segregation protein SMC [bacterium]
MYLKSLSIYGFKTFAKKTVLEFKPGTTAIIGPNGSGKSNLVDAIIWVMGEQSMRSIRGRKMEEVVFHGSEAHKPLGYSEVILTFDNEDGFFPLPHSEISVTRRYFKSGESEFEINRESCRLKDIQNLFLDTGLGANHYSIVNQGDVEYIINLSPAQRRVEIFDEAAGVNKYKIEKNKTLSKVKDTDQNIARVKDILKEIEGQLEPLSEQAEKAKRYEEITEEIERLKLGVFVSEIRRLCARLEEHKTDQEKFRKDREEKQAAGRKIRDKQTQLNSEIDSARDVVDHDLRELAVLGNRLGRAEEAMRSFRRDIEDVDRQIINALNQKKNNTDRIESIKNDIELLKKRSEEKKQRLLESQKELDDLSGQSMEDYRKREKELSEKSRELQKKVDEYSAQETEISREFAVTRDRLANLEKQIKTRESDRANIEKQIENIGAKIEKADSEIEGYEKNIAEYEKSKEELSSQLVDSEKEFEKKQAEYDGSQAACGSLAERISMLEKMAGLLSDSDNTNNLSKLADSIEVEEGYEAAARRALNDLMNAWSVDKDGLDRVVSEGASSAGIYLIKEWIDGKGTPDFSGIKGMKGFNCILGEKVTVKTEKGAVPGSLFERFAVIDSAELIGEYIDQSENGASIVSLDGNACFSDGILRVGEALPTHESMLNRIEDLRNELKKNEAKKESLYEELSGIKNRIADLKAKDKNVGNQLQKLKEEYAGAKERIQSNAEKAEFYKNEKESLDKAVNTWKASVEELHVSQDRTKARLETAREERAGVQSELDSIQQELNIVIDHWRKQDIIKSDRRVEIGELRREIEAGGESVQYREDELIRLKTRSEDLVNTIDILQKRKEESGREYEASSKEVSDWKAKQEASNASLNSKRSLLNESISEHGKLRAELEDLENQITDIKEKSLECELRHARAETQLEEIRRQFEEEFQGVSEEQAFEKIPEGEPVHKNKFISLRKERDSLMPVNQLAIGEYEEKTNRYHLLNEQVADLEETREMLLRVIEDFDRQCRVNFVNTFEKIKEMFNETFLEMFNGGEADLILTGNDDPLEAGVDIEIQIPGKRKRGITLLSGGEKALCALVLLFSILKVKPSPFYILDEVDAGLDESNVVRFRDMLKKYSTEGQFIVVTHNKGTIEGADHFFGITMRPDEGYTKILSVSID